jgi:hypothetical protein
MRRLLFLLLLLPAAAHAQLGAIQNYCNLGGSQAKVQALASTNYQQGIIPSCQVTVYLTGTQTLATIYSNATGTVLSNPFTATAQTSPNAGYWLFFAAYNVGYDVCMSGGIPPNTFSQPNCLTDIYPSSSLSPVAGVTSATGTAPILVNGVSATPETGAVDISCPTCAQGVLLNQIVQPAACGATSGHYCATIFANSAVASGPGYCASGGTLGVASSVQSSSPYQGSIIRYVSNFLAGCPEFSSINWTGATLPGYITATNVDAVYGGMVSGITCSPSNNCGEWYNQVNSTNINGLGGSSAPFGTYYTASPLATGSAAQTFNYAGVTWLAQNQATATWLQPPFGGTEYAMPVLFVDYTGTAPPAQEGVNVAPPLLLNQGTLSLLLPDNAGSDIGSVNQYVVNLPGYSNGYAYTAPGTNICVNILNTNTVTNPTLDFNGIGNITILNAKGGAIAVGDIVANQTSCFVMDYSQYWRLQNPQVSSAGGGSVTSVGLSMPSQLCTVSGSPVTSSGTLTCALSTETANYFFAGPSSGSAANPTWRAMVTADLPLSGATAGSYTNSNITINAQGQVTSASNGSGGGGGGYSGVIALTTSRSAAGSDCGHIIDPAGFTYTLPNPLPTCSSGVFSVLVQNQTTSVGQVALASGMTYNLSSSVPTLLQYQSCPVLGDTNVTTNYRGCTPITATGTNTTTTVTPIGTEINATGGSGSGGAVASNSILICTGTSWCDDDNHTQAPNVTVTAYTAPSSGVVTMTNSGTNGYYAGEWINLRFLTGWPLTNLGTPTSANAQGTLFQVLSTGLSSTQAEVNVGSMTGISACSSSCGITESAMNDMPFAIATRPGMPTNLVNNTYEILSGPYLQSLATNFNTIMAPLAPTTTGKPAYILINSPWNDILLCETVSNIESYYTTILEDAHTLGFKVIIPSILANNVSQADGLGFCSYPAPPFYEQKQLNEFLRNQSPTIQNQATGAYWDIFVDAGRTYNDAYDTTLIFGSPEAWMPFAQETANAMYAGAGTPLEQVWPMFGQYQNTQSSAGNGYIWVPSNDSSQCTFAFANSTMTRSDLCINTSNGNGPDTVNVGIGGPGQLLVFGNSGTGGNFKPVASVIDNNGGVFNSAVKEFMIQNPFSPTGFSVSNNLIQQFNSNSASSLGTPTSTGGTGADFGWNYNSSSTASLNSLFGHIVGDTLDSFHAATGGLFCVGVSTVELSGGQEGCPTASMFSVGGSGQFQVASSGAVTLASGVGISAASGGSASSCWATNGAIISSCGGGGGGVTWPTSGDLVISNSTSSPAGLAPVNGDCVVGSGGNWTVGSCSGGGSSATAAPPYLEIGSSYYIPMDGMYQATKPPTSPTWINGTAPATVTTGTNGNLILTGSSSGPFFLEKTGSSSAEASLGWFAYNLANSTFPNMGLWAYDSTNSKIYICEEIYNNLTYLQTQWQTYTYSGSGAPTYSATSGGADVGGVGPFGIVHMKLVASGGTLTCQRSLDGGISYQSAISSTISVGTISDLGVYFSPYATQDSMNLMSLTVN